jgi:hypothetical protein
MKQAIKTIITLMKQATAVAQKLGHTLGGWSRVLDADGKTWVSVCGLCSQALLVGDTLEPKVQGTATAHECPKVPTTSAVALADDPEAF